MKIYLVQHAKARSEEEDSARPLNEEGIKEIKNINRFLKNLKIKVSCIYHSEKLRAKQTALVLNESINSDRGTEELKGLKPNDDPAVINNLVNMQSDDLMLVGSETGLLAYREGGDSAAGFSPRLTAPASRRAPSASLIASEGFSGSRRIEGTSQ